MFLNHGDRAFKDVDMNQPIAADELPPHVCIKILSKSDSP